MAPWVSIAILAAVGAALRFGAANWLNTSQMPLGTLLVNGVGSLLIGWLFRIQAPWASTEVKMAVMVGFLGALTTFSSYSLELVQMLDRGRWAQAGVYFLLSQAICIGLCWVGWSLAKS